MKRRPRWLLAPVAFAALAGCRGETPAPISSVDASGPTPMAAAAAAPAAAAPVVATAQGADGPDAGLVDPTHRPPELLRERGRLLSLIYGGNGQGEVAPCG